MNFCGRALRFICCLLLLGWIGCGSGSSDPGRVLVLGFDGMDPQALDLLMSEGKMPNFAKLRQGGAYGRLVSQKPLLSPVVWTTIATGKTPEQHGIGHFVAINEKTGQQLPATSQMRKVKALWNILSEAGRQVGMVGYWATWPAETVKGTIVSDHACYHFLFEDGFTEKSEAAGRIFPASLEPVIDGMIRKPSSLTLQDVAPFLDVTPEEFARPFDFQDDLSHFKWALATAQSYEAIGHYLWDQQKPDFMTVYFEGTDSTAHLFGHLFRAEGLAGELAEQQKRYGRAVEAMYLYADKILGGFLEKLDDRTTLIVLSDHGFELGALPEDPSKTRDMRRVSEKYHHIEGILYLYGNRVKGHALLDRPSILDIAPTVLALSGLSPARDMPGRVLVEGLDLGKLPSTVPSYESGAHESVADLQGDSSVDPAILERLKSLGYLDASSPQGDRNLAAVQFEEGHYEEAIKAYQDLVVKNPDDGSLRASLAGALGAVGRYDEALVQLTESIRLEPLNAEAYHNRAVIFERKGNLDAAKQEYRQALRYNPQYEPSRNALARLGVTLGSGSMEPRTDAEKLAAAIADRASQEARRGDYAAAMAQLDEAEKIAPNYVLVQQYRSNVAFLMGDHKAALKALRRGLEIEPDNALFKTNLDRLLALSPELGSTPAPPPIPAQPSPAASQPLAPSIPPVASSPGSLPAQPSPASEPPSAPLQPSPATGLPPVDAPTQPSQPIAPAVTPAIVPEASSLPAQPLVPEPPTPLPAVATPAAVATLAAVEPPASAAPPATPIPPQMPVSELPAAPPAVETPPTVPVPGQPPVSDPPTMPPAVTPPVPVQPPASAPTQVEQQVAPVQPPVSAPPATAVPPQPQLTEPPTVPPAPTEIPTQPATAVPTASQEAPPTPAASPGSEAAQTPVSETSGSQSPTPAPQ